MKKKQALEIIERKRQEVIKLHTDSELKKQIIKDTLTAFDMAHKAIELIGCLNNRPCEACEYHGENGCCKWTCVFDELIYAEHRGEGERTQQSIV